MTIVFLDAFTTNPGDIDFNVLHDLGKFTAYDFTTPAQMPSRVLDADIIIVNKYAVSIDLLLNAPKLKYIVVAATGYNNIDANAVKSKGIPVSNVKGYSTHGVAQYVMASVLNHYNKLHYYHSQVAQNRWNISRDFCFYDHSFQDLSEITLGIIGFGAIGQKLATMAQGFGMPILVFSKYLLEPSYDFVKLASLDEIYHSANVISLHTPLNEFTHHLINSDALMKMKADALLINTGRGGLINEESLRAHLMSHPGFNAMVDVLSIEPPLAGNALLGLSNCYITPHIAWASKQSRQKLVKGLYENIKNFNNSTIKNQVL